METRVVKLRFREPVTYRLLFDACTALGLEVDRVIDDPQSALEGASPSIPEYSRFLAVVLEPASRWWPWGRPPDLEALPVDEALAVGVGAATDFFLHTWRSSVRRYLVS